MNSYVEKIKFSEFKKVSNVLIKNNIDFFFAKGFSFSYLINEDFFSRFSGGDIDIFINEKHVLKALCILKKLKYVPSVSSNFVKKINIPFKNDFFMTKKVLGINVVLDIHIGYFPYFVKENDFFCNKIFISCDFDFITLKPYYAFLFALDHAAKHKFKYLRSCGEVLALAKKYGIKIDEKNLKKLLKCMKRRDKPTEGNLKNYLEHIPHYSLKATLRHFLKHFFIPNESDYSFYKFKNPYFYFILRYFRSIISLWKKILKEITKLYSSF
jgi:hypothetical protein